jgi:DNA processing protein
VVVVQAAHKSGSLITAREAVKQGRSLMAVPGPAGSPLSAGVHQLIRRGARLIEGVADVLDVLSIEGQRQLKLVQAEVKPADLDENESRIWEALGNDTCAIDDISLRSGLRSSQVASLLLNLELRGLVTQEPGMVYSRCRTRG